MAKRRFPVLDGLLGLVVAGGLVLGPLAALFAFMDSPCGPDSTTDVCVLAAPHATAVLLPLIGGPLAAVLSLVLAFVRRLRRPVLIAGAVVVALVIVVPFVIIALAPDSYPNAYVPR